MKPDRNVQDRDRDERPFHRRVFLKSGITFSAAALTGVGLLHGVEAEKKSDEKEAEVGPPEDLMREHGVLKRVLLIYGEVLRRIDAKQDFPPEALVEAAGIIRSFVEDYHEKLERIFFSRALIRPCNLWTWSNCFVSKIMMCRASHTTL